MHKRKEDEEKIFFLIKFILRFWMICILREEAEKEEFDVLPRTSSKEEHLISLVSFLLLLMLLLFSMV
jgi:hypothetical protein